VPTAQDCINDADLALIVAAGDSLDYTTTSANCQACFVAANDVADATAAAAAEEACWKCTPNVGNCKCTVPEVMSFNVDDDAISADCRSCSYAAGTDTGSECVDKSCTGADCRCTTADGAVAAYQPCNADRTSCVSADCMACYTIKDDDDTAACYTPAPAATTSGAGTAAPVLALAATVAFLAL
jgi:hypothetical protein